VGEWLGGPETFFVATSKRPSSRPLLLHCLKNEYQELRSCSGWCGWGRWAQRQRRGRGTGERRQADGQERGFPTLRRLRLHLFRASTTHPLRHMRQAHGPAC